MTTEQDRLAVMEDILREARQIVSHPLVRARVPEAQARLRYLLQHGAFCFPVETETSPLGALKTGEPISPTEFVLPDVACRLGLTVMFPEDASKGSVLAYYAARVRYASYAAGAHAIVFNGSSDETRRFLGWSLLHEVGHARAAEREGRAFRLNINRPLDDRLQEEFVMWTFECRLAAAFGGVQYARALSKAVRRALKSRMERRNTQVSFHGRWRALDGCFGPCPPSLSAQENRDHIFSLYCAFSFADHAFDDPAGARECKIGALRNILEEGFQREQELMREFR